MPTRSNGIAVQNLPVDAGISSRGGTRAVYVSTYVCAIDEPIVKVQ